MARMIAVIDAVVVIVAAHGLAPVSEAGGWSARGHGAT